MKRFAPILCLAAAACIAPEKGVLEKLQPGTWVEAKGSIVDGKPVIDKVTELQRSDSDKADKVEILAQAARVTPSEIEVLGLVLKPDEETEYEGLDKKAIDKFTPAVGDALRLKLRHKEDEFRLRTLRKSEPREGFKVEGEILAVDTVDSMIDIGGIRLPLADSANVARIGDRSGSDPLALFQADDQKAVPFSVVVNDNLRLGGGVSIGVEMDDEYDLSQAVQRDRTKTSFDGKLDALWLFDDGASYLMFEAAAGRSDTFSLSSRDSHSEKLELTRAFGSLRLTDYLQLLVGRQDFTEERKWLFNEVLDAVRVMFVQGAFEADVGVATGRQAGAENNATEDRSMLNAGMRYVLDKDWFLGVYALRRIDDTIYDHEPLLFGVRSVADPRYGFGHWAELGFARGHSQWGINAAGADSELLDQVEDINGWAFDVGAMYTFDAALRPAFAAGYAYGSGEKDSADHQGYRQSGFQDNSDKLGGVTSVRYYGELYRPELTNLAVLTLAGSFRPTTNTSLSGIYHTYVQDFANQQGPMNDLRFSSSGSSPNGRDPDLGWEFDLVFGYRASRQVTLEIVGAHFEPGAAYNNLDAANKLDLTARFSF